MGASKLLKDQNLKEILIEIDNNIDDTKKIYDLLDENNFEKKNVERLGKNMEMITFIRK